MVPAQQHLGGGCYLTWAFTPQSPDPAPSTIEARQHEPIGQLNLSKIIVPHTSCKVSLTRGSPSRRRPSPMKLEPRVEFAPTEQRLLSLSLYKFFSKRKFSLSLFSRTVRPPHTKPEPPYFFDNVILISSVKLSSRLRIPRSDAPRILDAGSASLMEFLIPSVETVTPLCECSRS